MHHTNESYDHKSDRTSVDRISPNEKNEPSPKSTPQSSRASTHGETLKPTGLSFSAVDKNHQDDVTSLSNDVHTKNQVASSSDEDPYYSLKHLQERRRGKRDEDSELPRRVKRFYKNQDELIDVFERLHGSGTEHGAENDVYRAEKEKDKRISKILTKVSLGVNLALFILKIAGAVISHSLSVVSSVIDSAVDLTTSVILFWAWRAIKKRDSYRYPQGRTRLEPIAIVILSVIMCAASVLVIYESINTITNDAGYFTEVNTTKTLTKIDMSALPILVMAVTIVSKAILFFLCYRIKTPTMSALSSDHRNDVFSNIVALTCGLIGSIAYRKELRQEAIIIDPVGAILISFYIIFTWIRQANAQVKRLSGFTADPQFLSQITWITYHHSPLIEKIDTVRAFYFGTSFLVEVDIVLREDMMLKEAHDIGESLQKKIEELPEVERAFVHLDHEYSHCPGDEHKVV
ncbi:unnamed protein product [Rotaria socialis]|uniref:Cation efflux protein cytoplasmic domain-containing protein n=1 Tax=Rotaria socialis TaxID=392032 RepID=A0A818VW54_9BILA|nr:unnamed protein product [Rotaria socialis]